MFLKIYKYLKEIFQYKYCYYNYFVEIVSGEKISLRGLFLFLIFFVFVFFLLLRMQSLNSE